MKRFTTRILICLLPTLVSIGIVAWAVNQFVQGKGGFRMGVDLVGGTILVYEVDETRMPENFQAEDLAAALKRRIDPADLYNITIRPVAGTPPRVEIILPTGGRYQMAAAQRAWDNLLDAVAKQYKGDRSAYEEVRRGQSADLVDKILELNPNEDRSKVAAWVERQLGGSSSAGRKTLTEADIDNIKNLIERQGRLEFRILANTVDDSEAIEAARKWFADPKNQDELKRLEVRAEPPPPPRRADGGTEFTLRHSNGVEDRYAYRWVELGKSELYSVGLNNDAINAPGNETIRKQLEDFRNRGVAFLGSELIGSKLASSNLRESLLYTRTITDWGRRSQADRKQGRMYEYFVLVRESTPAIEVRGDDLTSAREGQSIGQQGGGRTIDFTFSPDGGERFYELTSRNKPEGSSEGAFRRSLGIIFDGQLISAPRLNAVIRSSGQITGEFTTQEINDMVRILRAGALPATLKKNPVSQNSMSSTLGEDTIQRGFWSIVWAFVTIMVFMVLYYRFAGAVACIALLANLLITVAFMVAVQAAFTLPGLAGLVLMLGMAVDANVLIYERIREERNGGASLPQAIRNGYERAFPTILDTHLSSIFTAIVLYVVGNDQLKGFGISLTAGLIISLFTALFMTRTIFDFCISKGWIKDLKFFPYLADFIHAHYINFMAIRHYLFTATAILTLLGGALFLYRADSDPKSGKATVVNIDFTGGTAFTGRLTKPMSLRELQEKLSQDPLPDQSLEQLFVSSEANLTNERGEAVSRYFTLRTSVREMENVQDRVVRLLGDALQKVRMSFPDSIDEKALQVPLQFTDQEGQPDFVSPATIASLLNDSFNRRGLARASFSLDRPSERSKEREERFSELVLRLNEPVAIPTLKEILRETQEQLTKSPIPERLENFDKQLAASTQERALYAILASWIAMLLYLWFRFGNWTFGLSAVLCLMHDLFFTLGVVAACHYIHGTWLGNLLGIQDFKIDLPAIASLLTLVGFSVNDTIVVFDRIREVRGKNPALTVKMINDSINQTLTRTLLASATVMLVVGVLYAFGGEGVKLFSFIMIIGVIVGTYSSIYVASPLLLLLGEGQIPGVKTDERPVVTPSPAAPQG